MFFRDVFKYIYGRLYMRRKLELYDFGRTNNPRKAVQLENLRQRPRSKHTASIPLV